MSAEAASCHASLESLTSELEAADGPLAKARLSTKLGAAYLRGGEADQALVVLDEARRTFDQQAEPLDLARCEAAIGQACTVKAEYERAMVFLGQAQKSADKLGDEDLIARVHIAFADIALATARPGDAMKHLDRARLHFEEFWDGSELSRIYAGLAAIVTERGNNKQAEQLAERAIQEAQSADDPLWLGRAQRMRARIHEHREDFRGAKRFFQRSITTFENAELSRELAESYLQYGLFVGASEDKVPEGFSDPAAFWLAKARALFHELEGARDLERVRAGFRRYGRRATDRIADVQVLKLLQELKRGREDVLELSQRVADLAVTELGSAASSRTGKEQLSANRARKEIVKIERELSSRVDEMAISEEGVLDALNSVVLERENIRTLLDLCRSLSMMRDYDQLPEAIAKMTSQLTGADRVLVAIVNTDGEPEVVGSVRFSGEHSEHWSIVRDTCSPSAGPRLVMATDREQTPLGARGTADGDAPANDSSMSLGVAMACPLRHGGKVFGAIYCDKNLCGGVFADRELSLMSVLAAQVATILENARVVDELRLAAHIRAATLEAISDGVFSLAPDGKITSIDATARRFLTLGEHEIATLRISALPDLSFLLGVLARNEEVDGHAVHLTSGEYIVNARCIQGDNGSARGLVATLTEMKRATSLAQKIVGSTARFTFGDIIGNAPSLRRRMRLAEAAARSDSSVLVTGESGTGKELMAQAIHNAGARASGPFVGINCAAIPRELLESELFGYEPGAFTGAKRGGQPGKFEIAEGGTILLDEIGDMPVEMQAKLLRVLQEKKVSRLGGTKEVDLDVRVIATTNRNLGEESVRGRFRQDLFFRLRVVHIELPPLRDRLEDIPNLVQHFLRLFAARLGKSVRAVSPEVMETILAYPWPGNIRELEHVLEGEVNLADDEQELLTETPVMLEAGAAGPVLAAMPALIAPEVQLPTVPAATPAAPAAPMAVAPVAPAANAVSFADNEKQLLMAALAEHRGRVPGVARMLGVSRGTVYNKMKKFDIDPSIYRGF